jgi:hypothetical protein
VVCSNLLFVLNFEYLSAELLGCFIVFNFSFEGGCLFRRNYSVVVTSSSKLAIGISPVDVGFTRFVATAAADAVGVARMGLVGVARMVLV